MATATDEVGCRNIAELKSCSDRSKAKGTDQRLTRSTAVYAWSRRASSSPPHERNDVTYTRGAMWTLLALSIGMTNLQRRRSPGFGDGESDRPLLRQWRIYAGRLLVSIVRWSKADLAELGCRTAVVSVADERFRTAPLIPQLRARSRTSSARRARFRRPLAREPRNESRHRPGLAAPRGAA